MICIDVCDNAASSSGVGVYLSQIQNAYRHLQQQQVQVHVINITIDIRTVSQVVVRILKYSYCSAFSALIIS